ncbi:MAG: hypothetical protein PHW53_01820 [Patescibacteria group bacterium]|nr:hypothetical protein [Patescibacteria group bacterium]
MRAFYRILTIAALVTPPWNIICWTIGAFCMGRETTDILDRIFLVFLAPAVLPVMAYNRIVKQSRRPKLPRPKKFDPETGLFPGGRPLPNPGESYDERHVQWAYNRIRYDRLRRGDD